MANNVDLTEYNGGALVGTAAVFLALTYFSVLLRTYVRAFLTNGFQVDDWLMLVAQVIFTMSCTFILIGVKEGIGFHNDALSEEKEIKALMWQALATATYVLNMMFIKLSIAVFLLRLAVQKRYKWTLYISMGVIAIWSTVLFFWDIFQCSPVQAQWDFTIPNQKCVTADQIVNAAYALSVMTIISDWLYALLPIPMIWQVKMTTQAKATVVVILGLGIFASIATLIRLKFLADLTDTADILFAGTDAMVWTLVEPGVAIVASSLVTIRPLLRAWRIKGFQSTENSRSYGFTGRSGGLRSGTQRSRRSNMPGFGPGDLTLIDMETGGRDVNKSFPSEGTTITDKSTASGRLSRLSVASGKTQPWGGAVKVTPRPADSPPESSKSGVFVIEGPTRVHEHWQGESSPSEASDDIHGLEAHSQHSGKVGLGWAR